MRRAPVFRSLCAVLSLSACLAHGAPAHDVAQSVLLVARPGMPDPNFSESVVLVTLGQNSEALGVILNRPLTRSLAEVLPGERFRRFTDPVYFGGPVADNALVALFQKEKAPGPVVTMLSDVFLALDPDIVDTLLGDPPATIRFYSGYSGWAPGQLKAEIERGDWLVLDADSETVFRADASRLWQDLVRRARALRADRGAVRRAAR